MAIDLSSLVTQGSCSLWKHLGQGEAFIVELSTSHRYCRLLSRHYVPTHMAN